MTRSVIAQFQEHLSDMSGDDPGRLRTLVEHKRVEELAS